MPQPAIAVMLKPTFSKRPSSAQVVKWGQNGVWLNSPELSGAIQREAANVGNAAIPAEQQFLKGFSPLFVPFSQIEWIAALSAAQIESFQ